jgi:hypothetical protein
MIAGGAEAEGDEAVSLKGTQVRRIRAEHINQEYEIHIYLPRDYEKSEDSYPVVYLTDSDAYFGFVKCLISSLQFGRLIPELIVVGIGYGEDVMSYLRKRERDLLPVEVEGRPDSGGAAAFLEFMVDEVMTFMEAEYRIDAKDRTLVGMSAGATFTSYVLSTRPGVFARYVIVSPYFIHGQEAVLQMEVDYAREHESLPARVYTAMGEMEPSYAIEPWEQLMDNLLGRDYPDLELHMEVLPELTHMEAVFPAYLEGIQYVFSDGPRALKAAQENYSACIGAYELDFNHRRFTVMLRGGRLFISGSGDYWDELIPVSETRYGIEPDDHTQFSFVAGEGGEVVEMIIHQVGTNASARKIIVTDY